LSSRILKKSSSSRKLESDDATASSPHPEQSFLGINIKTTSSRKASMPSRLSAIYEIIDKDNPVSQNIIDMCANAYRKNKEFFGKDCRHFKIRIANSEEEFKRLAGKFYHVWTKGVGRQGKFIAVKNLKMFEECYRRYGGTPDFEVLLAHEMNHVFAFQLNLYRGPYWFTEGLAMYVAGQIPGKTYRKNTAYTSEQAKKLLFYKLAIKRLSGDMYVPQYYGVKMMADTIGKERLLKLISSYKKGMVRKDYERNFKTIVGVPYEKFLEQVSSFVSQATSRSA
jgi:hypothetical protein